MPVDPNDYLEQKKVYTFRGKGRWKILGYIPGPSLAMVNIDDHNRRRHFGIKGITDKDFNEIPSGHIEVENRTELPFAEKVKGLGKLQYDALMGRREDLVAAFIAETGCLPSEAVMIEYRSPSGNLEFWIEKRKGDSVESTKL